MTPPLPVKTKRITSLLIASSLGFALTLSLSAQGPGRGGRGPGGGGPGGFQEAIHTLFDNHTKIKRSVELTDSGYKSRTVSDDPEIAKTLQKHVREMRERLGSGRMIRRWDPAFAELVEHYDAIDHEFKEVDGGVEMIASGKTPEAVKVAQNHARIVSGFVEKGPAQMHEKHARALASEAPESTDAQPKDPAPADHEHGAPADKPAESTTPESKDKTKPCCQKTDGPKQQPKDGEAGPACCRKPTEKAAKAKEAKPGCSQAKECCGKQAAPAPNPAP